MSGRKDEKSQPHIDETGVKKATQVLISPSCIQFRSWNTVFGGQLVESAQPIHVLLLLLITSRKPNPPDRAGLFVICAVQNAWRWRFPESHPRKCEIK